MGVSADILRSWRHPRRVIAGLMAQGRREDRALVFLILGCSLMFVAQWPRLMLESRADPSVALQIRLGAALLGWLFFAPLTFYLIAAISRVIAKLAGGTGSWFSARLALFWALLAASPLWLLNGLITGLSTRGSLVTLSGSIALAGFGVIWIASLLETETPGGQE